ncbi:MAG: HNH endonuclease [Thiotrichales bacterium]|nr:MAG: HNH endonuclease [Thiotrichales bacterium]
MKLHKYTETQLREAVKNSTSMRQVLQRSNVATYVGNYDVLRNARKHFQIDTSHFTGQAWNKGKKLNPNKQSIDAYLSNKITIQSFELKNRLLKENIFEHICSNCNRTEWLDKPIPLELDHINGNNKDNRLSNLRLLCPNCHALTPTYRSKNRSKV